MPGGHSLACKAASGLLLVPIALLLTVLLAAGHTPVVAPPMPVPLAAAEPPLGELKLEKGDHVCIIGNTLAERMQHDGWLEAALHARYPNHNLTIRNLGYSGDEIGLRLRSQDFGTPDQWLSASAPIPQPNAIADKSVVNPNRFEKAGTKADVIFAFFGYNESFAGEAGLPKFKTDLETFIKHTLAQKYNGKSGPRLTLFSPIAFEDHKSPNLPHGEEIKGRQALFQHRLSVQRRLPLLLVQFVEVPGLEDLARRIQHQHGVERLEFIRLERALVFARGGRPRPGLLAQ